MKPILSSHYSHDPRHYQFVRNSRLPLSTFSRGIDPDHIVFGLCLALAVIAGLALAMGAIS